jgi:hypothetical protein
VPFIGNLSGFRAHGRRRLTYSRPRYGRVRFGAGEEVGIAPGPVDVYCSASGWRQRPRTCRRSGGSRSVRSPSPVGSDRPAATKAPTTVSSAVIPSFPSKPAARPYARAANVSKNDERNRASKQASRTVPPDIAGRHSVGRTTVPSGPAHESVWPVYVYFFPLLSRAPEDLGALGHSSSRSMLVGHNLILQETALTREP